MRFESWFLAEVRRRFPDAVRLITEEEFGSNGIIKYRIECPDRVLTVAFTRLEITQARDLYSLITARLDRLEEQSKYKH